MQIARHYCWLMAANKMTCGRQLVSGGATRRVRIPIQSEELRRQVADITRELLGGIQ